MPRIRAEGEHMSEMTGQISSNVLDDSLRWRSTGGLDFVACFDLLVYRGCVADSLIH